MFFVKSATYKEGPLTLAIDVHIVLDMFSKAPSQACSSSFRRAKIAVETTLSRNVRTKKLKKIGVQLLQE